jgi:hypothetical protein
LRAVLLCGAAALVLSGCHGDDGAHLSQKDRKAEAAIDAAIATNRTAARENGLPVPQPSAVALKYDLPEHYLGKWGMTRADCDPDRVDRKGLLVIEPTKLNFYESKGTVMAIDKSAPYDVTVTLSMVGEGQRWNKVTELRLDAAATRLDRIERSPAGTYRYQRC